MNIQSLFDSTATGQISGDPEGGQSAQLLGTLTGARVYPRSITSLNGKLYFLMKEAGGKYLAVVSQSPLEIKLAQVHQRRLQVSDEALHLTTMPLNAPSAIFLRQQINWLQPTLLGLSKSAGCGDRLGLATPGHVRAIRSCKGGVRPIYAQQSIREMARTSRTPTQVLDDAMWGAFQEGWRSGFGADADHLKTYEDIDSCVAAGYTFYTFDPGAYVDNESNPAKFEQLPWADLETTISDTHQRYSTQMEPQILASGLVKYGRALVHVKQMYRHLRSTMAGRPYEVEVSVDETDQPTTASEHLIIATELHRLGVEWVSLAPRFVGRFEKGVDYIGDVNVFEKDCAEHARLARQLGPYKLSIHSGSDKFSIYPIVVRWTGELVHLKTAGTSYLEALRTVARCDANLFRQVYRLAHERYAEDRASYHVSADPARAPRADLSGVNDLQAVLNQFDARQMLHVCFGSILATYGEPIKAVLEQNEETHYADLERHFKRHLEAFC